MTIDIKKLAVECGLAYEKRGKLEPDTFDLDTLQAFAEAVAKEVKAENEALKREVLLVIEQSGKNIFAANQANSKEMTNALFQNFKLLQDLAMKVSE